MAAMQRGTAEESPPHRHGNFQAAKEGWLKLCASYPNLSGADYAVAIALSTYFNSKTRDAWPSFERLAVDTNRNRSTVWRSLRRFENMNLIEVIHGRGRHKVNRYRPKLGCMHVDLKILKRRTTLRGKTLRTCNEKTANSQQKHCELAVRTSD
jgi:hypothetical protein